MFCWWPGQRADRHIGVGLGDHVADVVERDVARRRRHRIDLDAHGEFLRAVDQHLRDAGQLRDLLRRAVSPYSSTVDSGSVGEMIAMNRTGKSPGLTLRKHGGVVISAGRRRCATVSAVCTSSAAPSMSRLRSNWMVIDVVPSEDDDVIDEMPAMVESWRSIGDATEAAMVSGLAPGNVRRDLDGREIDLRQRRDRQQPVGEGTEHDERRRDQRRHHRPANAGFRKTHRSASRLAARAPSPWRRWSAAAGRR